MEYKEDIVKYIYYHRFGQYKNVFISSSDTLWESGYESDIIVVESKDLEISLMPHKKNYTYCCSIDTDSNLNIPGLLVVSYGFKDSLAMFPVYEQIGTGRSIIDTKSKQYWINTTPNIPENCTKGIELRRLRAIFQEDNPVHKFFR